MISRREDPHPGAQFSFSNIEGHRCQCFMCDSPDADIACLEARHRGRARVEDRIRAAKDLGLRNLPFSNFAAGVGPPCMDACGRLARSAPLIPPVSDRCQAGGAWCR